MIKVEFRKDKEGDVFAVFPDTVIGLYVQSYAHIGQHSMAHIGYVAECEKATPDEYAELEKELREIGYKFD